LGLYVSVALWGEEEIEQRPLFWIAGEDQDGLKPLLEAWMKHNPGRSPDARYIDQAVDFASTTETNKLIKHLQGQPRPLIMADALSDVLAIQGLDEDKSQQVIKVYKGVRRVVDALNASFGVLHHQGWTGKRERGSTAIRDNSDVLVTIKKFDPVAGIVELEHLKRRSGAGPKLKAFYLNAKLITVDGYKDQIPIVTGPRLEGVVSGQPTAAGKAAGKPDNKEEENLIEMIMVLRRFFGNRGTRGQWQKQMQGSGEAGWSKSSFDRRLRVLKARRWVGIVGDPDADLERVPDGALFEATEIAPGAPPRDGTNTTYKTDGAAKTGTAESQSTGITGVTPLEGGGDTTSCDTGYTQDRPVSAVSNRCHDTSDTSSNKSGNGSDPVVPDDMNGSAAELDEAAKAAMELLKMGKPPHAA
jgi:hypothetical protein